MLGFSDPTSDIPFAALLGTPANSNIPLQTGMTPGMGAAPAPLAPPSSSPMLGASASPSDVAASGAPALPSGAAPASGGFLSKIHDWLDKQLLGNAPAGYSNLLTPDEIESAKPNLLHALIGGPDAPSAEDAWKNHLDNIIKAKSEALGLAQTMRIMQGRQQIQQQFAPQPNETPEQTNNRLQAMYAAFVQNGDTEMVDKMARPAAAGMHDPNNGPTRIGELKTGDQVILYDTRTGAKVGAYDVHDNPDDIALKKAQIAAELAKAEESRANTAANLGLKAQTEFANQNKDLLNYARPYAATKNAFAQARAGNPAALEPAILSYASTVDPKGLQLRQGIINMIQQVDPSVQGRADLAMNRLSTGTLPPRVLDQMEQLIDKNYASFSGLYKQRRDAYIKQHPAFDSWIPQVEDAMGTGALSPAPTSGTPSKIDAALGRKP